MNPTHRNTIRICRAYTPPLIREGVWIFIDRLWSRDLKKETLTFNFWLKDITPNVTLKNGFTGTLKKQTVKVL